MQTSGFDGSEFLKVAFAAVTTVVTLYNWQAGRRRGKLKDDLDILKRYREEWAADTSAVAGDDEYLCLRDKIQHRMRKAYVLRGTDHSDLFTGIGFAALAAFLLIAPEYLPFGLRIRPEWRGGAVAVAGGGALYFMWEAVKNRRVARVPGSTALHSSGSGPGAVTAGEMAARSAMPVSEVSDRR